MSGILQGLIASISSAAAAVTDAYFNLVTLLLNTSSTNGAQNNTFLDSSSNAFTITRNGNTTQGTFTPFSQTGWSNYFTGSSSYLSLPSNSALAVGSGDFTIEAWVYITGGTYNSIYDTRSVSSDAAGFVFAVQTGASGAGAYLYNGTAGVIAQTGNSTVSNNGWYHVAFSRSGTSLRGFVNGVLLVTATNSTNFSSLGATFPFVGTSYDVTSDPFVGYISNFRIVKGTAVYTSSFTPSTTPLTAITNTSLLTCQSNRFKDNSTNAFAITANGSPSVQAFSPFAPTTAYDTAVVGGSGYFDGTGDFLQLADSTAWDLTGDYTIEMWLYSTATPVSTSFFQIGDTSNYLIIYLSSATKYITTTGSLSITASTALVLNTWNHVALVRSGSGTNNTVLYLNGINVGQATNTTSFTGSASNGVRIGAEYPSNYYFNGYIAGNRIVNGTAVYTANFTPPTAPPTAVTNTQLLLNYTNAGIYDSAAKNDLETVGNAQVSTTQAKWGSTSMYFDGTGDWLYNAASSPNVAFGTGNFTVEMWVYPTTNPANGPGTLMDARNSSTSEGWVIRIFADLSVGFYDGPANVYQQTAASAVPLNTWTYLAFVRSGTTLTIYVNGTSAKTATVSSNLGTSWPFYVGNNYTAGYTYYGYIDDLRITKGYARTISASPSSAFPIQ